MTFNEGATPIKASAHMASTVKALHEGAQPIRASADVAAALSFTCETAAKELHTTLSRALEFGMQQAAHHLGDFAASSWCLAASSTMTCSCEAGYYANTQIIANLLHLVVQLALFPTIPSAKVDKSLQIGAPMCAKFENAAAQTRYEVYESATQVSAEVANCETQVSPEVADTSLQCGAALSELQEKWVETQPLLSESIAQTDGEWLECATKGVRIGGGYHLFRSIASAGDRSVSPVRPSDVDETMTSQRSTKSRGRQMGRKPKSIKDTWSLMEGLSELEECAAETVKAPQYDIELLPDTEIVTNSTQMREETSMRTSYIDQTLVSQDVEPPTVAEWVDEQFASGSRPPMMWQPEGAEAASVYNHYVHGVPAHGSPPNHFRVGAYSQDQQRSTLSRREIAESISAGRWDNVQLYRVLRADLQQPPMTADFPTSPLRQGSWRRRPASAPIRRNRMSMAAQQLRSV